MFADEGGVAQASPELTVDFAGRLPPALLDEYFELRNWWYGRRHGIDGEAAPRDAFDDESLHVLATDGRRCLGGARITIREAGAGRPLPMEALCDGLSVAGMFPDLPLDRAAHAEFSKLIVARREGALPFHNTVADRIFRFLWGPDNPRPDVRYALSFAPRAQSRIYRALADAHGLSVHARPVPPELVPPSIARREFAVQVYVLDPGGRS